jgi:hypothetical protein
MSDVIAHSPMTQGHGELPHRIVIRDLGGEYVVHMEIHEPGKKPWYHQGDYIPKRDDPEEALWRAWERMEERARRTMQMDPPPADKLRQMAGVAESIIESLLPDDNEYRTDQVEEDYQLKSDLDTFEHLTGKALYEPREDEDEEEDDEIDDED